MGVPERHPRRNRVPFRHGLLDGHRDVGGPLPELLQPGPYLAVARVEPGEGRFVEAVENGLLPPEDVEDYVPIPGVS